MQKVLLGQTDEGAGKKPSETLRCGDAPASVDPAGGTKAKSALQSLVGLEAS